MSYTTKYVDEQGNARDVSVTEAESREALLNDYQEICRKYNPKYVVIQRLRAEEGEAMHLRITVHAPSHYLVSSNDNSPKECASMSADIICYPGYPLKSVKAYYPENRFLASPNVFRSGAACIDNWIPLTSSLTTVVEKLVRDMIHDGSVTNYSSMANPYMEEWHKAGVKSGRFPTIQPKLLFVPERTALPPRRTERRAKSTPPALPGRRH